MKKEKAEFFKLNINSFKQFNNFHLRKKQSNNLNNTMTVRIPLINQNPNKKLDDIFSKKNNSFNTRIATQYIYNPLKIKNDANYSRNNSHFKIMNEYFPLNSEGNNIQLNNHPQENIKIKLIKFNKNIPIDFKNRESIKFKPTYQINHKNINKNSDFLKYIEYNGMRKFNPKNLPIKPNFKTLEQINYNQISYDQKKNNTLDIKETNINNDYFDNKKKKELSSESSKDQGELSLGEVADIIIYYSFKRNKKEDNFLFYKNDVNKFKSENKENYLKFFLK
jgi:hypothetical protein